MYIVQEIQTENNQSSLLPAVTFTNELEAISTFHSKLASAAISSVDIHTVIMFDEYGNVLKQEFYEHVG